MNPSNSLPQSRYVFFTVILVIVMALVALLLPTRVGMQWWIAAWIVNLVLMFVIMGMIGLSVKASGGFWAIFVDNRNMVSLSRFQIVLWTLVILSAFWTIALARIGDSTNSSHADAYVCESSKVKDKKTTCAAPADLQLPGILWALMGISITSAVASPLIKENKAQSTHHDHDAYAEVVNHPALQSTYAEFENRGALAVRKAGEKPSFSDMFKGEEVGSLAYVDIAKVQNFFFTVVAVAAYAVALGAAIAAAGSISGLVQFPDLSEGLVGILGFSHAGYLVNKASVPPKPQVPPDPPPPQDPPPPNT